MNITELINSRRTIRKFSQEPIKKELIEKYINCARVAPSAANLQPLKYIGINSKEMTDKIFPHVKWAGYLAPNYNPKDDERPTAYIAICGDKNIRESGYDMDIGAAAENIILSALEDGIGSCWMLSIDKSKISEILNLDPNIKLCTIIALGYPLESPKEVNVVDNNIKYYLNDNNTLCVPKRSMEDVIIKIV